MHCSIQIASPSDGSINEAKTNFTVITYHRISEPKFGLSVCLSPIFGEQSSWLLLTELIEHYKLYGVQHFYLYVQAIDEYSEKVGLLLYTLSWSTKPDSCAWKSSAFKLVAQFPQSN